MAAPLPHQRRLRLRSQARDTASNKQPLRLHITLGNARNGDMREYQFDFPSWNLFVGLTLMMLASALDVCREIIGANWLLAIFGCLVMGGSAFWLVILWRDKRRPSA